MAQTSRSPALEGRCRSARLSAQRHTYRIPIATQRANGSYQLTIGAGVQDQEGTLLGSAFQSSFTVSLPDLVVSTVTRRSSSATFGDTINVELDRDTNKGTAAATGPWVDNVYLSTTPALGAARST